MRNNQPVTNEEVVPPADAVLASRTDTGGRILYANSAFIETSGFTAQELLGQPHNMVRHPDMPKEAFANLWETIKAGRPWEGLVKNRAKNGAFYWVRANVTPVTESGTLTGYLSLRSIPSREAVLEAEQTYRAIREGTACAIQLRDGELIRVGWRERLGSVANSIGARMMAAVAAVVFVLLLVGLVSYSGMTASHDALRTVHADRLVPVAQLAGIRSLIQQDQLGLWQAALTGRGAEAAVADAARRRRTEADRLWTEYRATYLTPEETVLAARFEEVHAAYRREGLDPALVLVAAGNSDGLRAHLRGPAEAQSMAVEAAIEPLIALQLRVAEEELAASSAIISNRTWTVVAAALIGSAIAWALTFLARQALREAISQSDMVCEAVMQGHFNTPIATPKAHEFYRLIATLRALRAHLAFAEAERREATARNQAVVSMADTVEKEARAAVEKIAARTAAMASEAAGMAALATRLSDSAGEMAATAGEARDGVHALAAASEEFAASIREINDQTLRAGEITRQAVEGGERAGETIHSLSETVGRIGDVVQLIRSIAEQTNLLALNATIEAARAGEAGKGFAVVAGEVKGLAGQTARSTEEIARQIAEVQAGTAAAVQAVQAIGGQIGQVSDVAIAIAAAMEEQAMTTQEIARNVSQANEAVRKMSEQADAVSTEAGHAGTQAAAISGATADVAKEVSALQGTIVRVVRTSVEEADRRVEPRLLVQMPCRVEAGSRRQDAVLENVSRNGAMLSGIKDARQGETLLLTPDRAGEVRARGRVIGVSDVFMHLRIEEDDVQAGWGRWVDSIPVSVSHAPRVDRRA